MSEKSYQDTGLAVLHNDNDRLRASTEYGNGDFQYSHYAVSSAFMPYSKDTRQSEVTPKSSFLMFTDNLDQDENDLEVETILNSGFIPRFERHELPYIFAFEELYGGHGMGDENERCDGSTGMQMVVERDWDYWFMDEENVVYECMDEGLFWKD